MEPALLAMARRHSCLSSSVVGRELSPFRELFLEPTQLGPYFPVPMGVAAGEAVHRFTQNSTFERTGECCQDRAEEAWTLRARHGGAPRTQIHSRKDCLRLLRIGLP